LKIANEKLHDKKKEKKKEKKKRQKKEKKINNNNLVVSELLNTCSVLQKYTKT